MHKGTLSLLVLILVLSATLNFYRLGESSLFAFDEGIYFNLVKTMRAPVDFAIEKWSGKTLASFGQYLHNRGGYHFMAAKPTYLLISFLVSLVMGLKDYTLPVTSGIFGVLVVLLVFAIARRLYDDAAALIAALITAVSWFQVSYARSAFPHMTGIFFAYMALYLYIRLKQQAPAARRTVFLYGLCLGLSFTSHYSFFWLLAIFGVSETLFLMRDLAKGRSEAVRRFLVWLAALALPILFWQAATLIAKAWIGSHPAYSMLVKGMSGEGEFLTYFSQLYKQVFSANRQTGYEGNTLFYARVVMEKEGPVFLLFFLSGFVLYLKDILKRPGLRMTALTVMLYFLLPFLLFGLYSHFPTTRTFSVAVPAICLIAARPVFGLLRRNRIAAFLLLALTVAGQLAHTVPLLSYRSGFKEALAYMESHDGIRHISSNVYVSRAYVDRFDAVDMSFSFREKKLDPTGKLHVSLPALEGFVEKNRVQYLLLDQYRFSYPNEILAAASRVKPIFAAPHTTINFLYDSKKEYQDQILKYPQVIEVYAIKEIMQRMAEDAKD